MKNKILSAMVMAILIPGYLIAANVNVSVSPGSATHLQVCKANHFIDTLTGLFPATPFTIDIYLQTYENSPSTPVVQPCYEGATTGPDDTNHITVENIQITSGGTLGTYNQTGNLFTFTITDTSSNTIILEYDFVIDCSLIPQADSSSTIYASQTWSANGGGFTINSASQWVRENMVDYPYLEVILPIVPSPITYGDVVTLVFEYRNTRPTPAEIVFWFDNPGVDTCGAAVLTDITTSCTVNGTAVSYTPGAWSAAVTVNAFQSIIITQQVLITGCLNTCHAITAQFKWKCSNADLYALCDECLKQYNYPYDLLYPVPNNINLLVQRLLPLGNENTWDNSCPGLPKKQWEYKITNQSTSTSMLKNFDILLVYQAFDFAFGKKGLTLIDSSDIEVDTSNCTCTIDSVSRFHWNYTPYTLTPDTALDALCASEITNPLRRYRVYINDLDTGEYVTFKFKTYRCCEENDALFNVPKLFNWWNLYAGGVNECGQAPNVTGANGQISPHPAGQNAHYLNLDYTFNPTVTDLAAPSDSLGAAGGYADFDIITDELFESGGMWSLVGYSGPGSSIYGTLKVVIECDPGLRVENPGTDVTFKKFDGSAAWPIIACESDNMPPQCGQGNFSYYFDLADSNASAILDNGRFRFRLTSCCMGEPHPDYKVKFYLLMNDTCYDFTTVPSTSPCGFSPSCSNCCWLPLNSIEGSIHVHCPGCLAPGIIVSAYKLNRVSLGYEDTDNNKIADGEGIPITPGYVHYSDLDVFSSNYGDVLEDRMNAWLVDGDPTNTPNRGYSYEGQMIPSGAILDVMQLDRTIPHMDTSEMNLQIDTIIFYIDTLATDSTDCYECDGYYGTGYRNYKTLQKLKIVAPACTLFYSRDDATDRFFFTFLSSDFVGPSYSDHPSPAFVEFHTGQRYRMKVTYRVCGNTTGTAQLTSDIGNRLWLTGTEQNFTFTTQMPNDEVELNDAGWTAFDSTCCTPLNNDFAEAYLFICETFGGLHFFNPVNATAHQWGLSELPDCRRMINTLSQTDIYNGSGNTYHFEFKSPPISLDSIFVNIPPGWELYDVQYSTKVDNTSPVVSAPDTAYSIDIGGILTDTTSINSTEWQPLSCYTDSSNILDDYLSGDEKTIQRLNYFLQPVSCMPDSVTPLNDTTVVSTFTTMSADCYTPAPANCDTALRIDTGLLLNGSPALSQLNPHIDVSFTSVTPDQTHICWNFTITNLPEAGENNTGAVNLFLNIPDSPFLTNYDLQITYPFDSIYTETIDGVNNIYHLFPVFSIGSQVSGIFCADITSCDTIALDVQFGWDCDSFPMVMTEPLCQLANEPIEITPVTSQFSAIEISPGFTTFTPCQAFTISAALQSNAAGNNYPALIGITTLLTGFTVEACSLIYNCGPDSTNLSVDLFPAITDTGYSFAVEITQTDLQDLGVASDVYDGMALGECLELQITLLPDCDFDGTLPGITVEAHNYCGVNVNQLITYANNLTPSGNDNCDTVCNPFTCDSLYMSYIEKEDCQYSFVAQIPGSLPCSGASVVEWDFGDGDTATGVSVQHQYIANDTYIVCYRYICYEGETPSDTCEVCDTIIVSCTHDSTLCRRIEKAGHFDIGEAVMATNDGGCVIAGTMFKDLPLNDRDMYFVKYDASLDDLTAHGARVGGSLQDHGFSVLHRPGDGYYIAGTVDVTATDRDIYVAKLKESDFSFQWGYRYGYLNGKIDEARKIIDMSTPSEQSLLIVGFTNAVSPNFDVVALKIRPSGAIGGINTFNGPNSSHEYAFDVAKWVKSPSKVSYYIVGERTLAGAQDAFVIRMEQNLSYTDARIIDYEGRNELASGITIVPGVNSADLYVTGSVENGANSLRDVYLFKLDQNLSPGSAPNSLVLGHSVTSYEAGWKIKNTDDDKLIIAGENGTSVLNGPDALLLKIDPSNMSLDWSNSTSLEEVNELYRDVCQLNSGEYVATGSFNVNTGDDDIFVSKITPDGKSCCLLPYTLKTTSFLNPYFYFKSKEVHYQYEGYGNAITYYDHEPICPGGHYANRKIAVENSISHIKIYPNPARDEFVIDFMGMYREQYFDIKFFDVTGRLIKNSRMATNKSSKIYVDARVFPGGVYFIEITNSLTKWNSKVLINK